MSAATSLTEQNRAIVEAMFEAANSGDIEGVVSYLSDDVTIDEPLFLPFGTVYHGKDEFFGLAQVMQNYLDVSSITVHYTIADGDRVAACIGIPDVTTGELTHFIEQFTIKDGKIVENRPFYNNAGTLVDKPKVV
ncbi:nuclear transport factor 2 family protein [Streptomyces sp. NRRL S-1824]|uniref:nuclear transport factor 2 family protein n=1 Tax=Streptomyces sp. NRRL S-1824 TaxID=1463889 RepID=UPI0004C6B6B0|nr:nuclear transport factor 2 family protein [Streptomyces sp. NRRL S-1824]